VSWVKINVNGIAKGCPSVVAFVNIFKGSQSKYIGSLFSSLEIQNSLYVKIMRVILIEFDFFIMQVFPLLEVMEFKISHVFRKGDNCVDKLTNMGIENKIDFKWYFVYNRFQLPYFILFN